MSYSWVPLSGTRKKMGFFYLGMISGYPAWKYWGWGTPLKTLSSSTVFTQGCKTPTLSSRKLEFLFEEASLFFNGKWRKRCYCCCSPHDLQHLCWLKILQRMQLQILFHPLPISVEELPDTVQREHSSVVQFFGGSFGWSELQVMCGALRLVLLDLGLPESCCSHLCLIER